MVLVFLRFALSDDQAAKKHRTIRTNEHYHSASDKFSCHVYARCQNLEFVLQRMETSNMIHKKEAKSM